MPYDVPEMEGLSRDQVLTLVNCKDYAQYLTMMGNYLDKKCPFCDPLDKKNVVIKENGYWRMWQNPHALKHTAHHFILAHQRHDASVDSMGPADFAAMGELFFWINRRMVLLGGALVMRFGSPDFNAGSVLHPHANIVMPNGTGDVRVTLAKTPEEVAAAVQRMRIYEQLRNREVTPATLTNEDMKLVAGRI